MYSERQSSRYTPTSPLSPRLPDFNGPISPQSRSRTMHSTQATRSTALPRYHPATYQSPNSTPLPNAMPNPTLSFHKVSQPVRVESPRLMRERQRELIDKAKMSSRIAASSLGIKPGAPRLDPLGSPKGPVTPLALEEAADYFLVAGGGVNSPSTSPGSRNDGTIKDVGDKAKMKRLSKDFPRR